MCEHELNLVCCKAKSSSNDLPITLSLPATLNLEYNPVQYSLYCILLTPLCIAWFIPQRLQIDTQLLRFLIEVAAFET